MMTQSRSLFLRKASPYMFHRALNTPLSKKTYLTGDQPETFTKRILLYRYTTGPCFQLSARMYTEPLPILSLRLLDSENGCARRVKGTLMQI